MKRAAAAICLIVLSLPSAAAAIISDDMQGYTWFSDGTFTKTGGGVVTAYATSARINLAYRLVASPIVPNTIEQCTPNETAINPLVRYSNERGFIPYTAGQISGPPRSTGCASSPTRTLPPASGRAPCPRTTRSSNPRGAQRAGR